MIDRVILREISKQTKQNCENGSKKAKSVDSPKFKFTKLEESVKSYEALVMEASERETQSKISSFFQRQNEKLCTKLCKIKAS